MAVSIEISYEGALHCRAVHGPSGQSLLTDAPTDNGGKGEAFSPTDLVATGYGTCIITVMAMVAEREGIELAGTKVSVLKEMTSKPVRRIGALRVQVAFPASLRLTPEQRVKLEHAAHTCPVNRTLHPDTQQIVEFLYPA